MPGRATRAYFSQTKEGDKTGESQVNLVRVSVTKSDKPQSQKQESVRKADSDDDVVITQGSPQKDYAKDTVDAYKMISNEFDYEDVKESPNFAVI